MHPNRPPVAPSIAACCVASMMLNSWTDCFELLSGRIFGALNEISHFFLPLSRYIQSMYLIDHPNTTMKFKHVALKISGEGLDVSLLSLYKKYKSTNKNSQF